MPLLRRNGCGASHRGVADSVLREYMLDLSRTISFSRARSLKIDTCSFLRATDEISHPYKADKTNAVYISDLIFTFSVYNRTLPQQPLQLAIRIERELLDYNRLTVEIITGNQAIDIKQIFGVHQTGYPVSPLRFKPKTPHVRNGNVYQHLSW